MFLDEGCLQELQALVNCLIEFEYENKRCAKQSDTLMLCYTNHLKNKAANKRAKELGKLVPYEKVLTHKQVKNLLLKRPVV